MVVETDDAVYCFEFKLNDTPEAALKQIDDKGYLVPYSTNGKQLVKVGVKFDGEKRMLGEWIVVKG